MQVAAVLFVFSVFTISGFGAQAQGSSFLSNACTSDSSCPADQCCYMSGNRFAVPQCAPRLKEGDVCRPGDNLVNGVLNYPNNNQLTVSGVHSIICPCSSGLRCAIEGSNTACRR